MAFEFELHKTNANPALSRAAAAFQLALLTGAFQLALLVKCEMTRTDLPAAAADRSSQFAS
jgi:hypothetical protein